ncbi:unnamed protein product [Peronospora farinosa]|uniref:Integrase catalytic domain-containing protein n=1 Tax=Peronospora farinosa TaxID=134698 RepID=A0AAV0SRI2_9STRA|nr:unnamed protein product [Peronospora farinosa]
MSDFFRAFNRMIGQKQRATMAYRPQANGTAERMVQTITRAIKMYVSKVDQKDWDAYAERLTFALNTAHGPGPKRDSVLPGARLGRTKHVGGHYTAG